MQTFAPTSKSFAANARRLDNKRLPNQANEALAIYRTLIGHYSSRKNGSPGGWPNHPATRMWRGYEAALLHYRQVCINECARRLGRHYIGSDLDPHWAEYANKRLALPFARDMFDAHDTPPAQPETPTQRELFD